MPTSIRERKKKKRKEKLLFIIGISENSFKCPVKFDPHNTRRVKMDPGNKHSTTFLEMCRFMFSWFIIFPN